MFFAPVANKSIVFEFFQQLPFYQKQPIYFYKTSGDEILCLPFWSETKWIYNSAVDRNIWKWNEKFIRFLPGRRFLAR